MYISWILIIPGKYSVTQLKVTFLSLLFQPTTLKDIPRNVLNGGLKSFILRLSGDEFAI